MKEVTVQQLKAMKDSQANFQLIDVREPYEYDIVQIEGKLIPMGEITSRTDEISRDKEVILHCRSGKRSAAVIDSLQREYGFENLYNLKGGILAYIEEVDSTLTAY